MSVKLIDQLGEYGADEQQQRDDFTMAEVLSRGTFVRPIPTPQTRKPFKAVPVALAAAIVAVLVLAIPLVLSRSGDVPPATTPSTVSTTVQPDAPFDSLPRASGVVFGLAGSPTIEEGHEPLGPVSVSRVSTETDFVPGGRLFVDDLGWTNALGGVVETANGYTALGVSTETFDPRSGVLEPVLAVSSDGVGWEIIDFQFDIPGFRFGTPARLFEAGGWYWIGMNEPFIYRSADSIIWERIDLDGAIPRPMGTPLADQRWHEFGDRIVADTSEGLLTVNVNSGAVAIYDQHPPLPDRWMWRWMTVIDGKLTAFVSAIPDEQLSAASPAGRQYETTDLITWTGPLQPAVASDETTGLLIHGDVDSGLIALEATGGLFRTPRRASVKRYVSSDGLSWRQAATVQEVNEPKGPDSWTVLDHYLAPIRIDGQQGIIYQLTPGTLHLSGDGVTWQEIRLDGQGSRQRDGSSLTVVDNRIYYIEYTIDSDGPWTLDTWIISIGD